MKQITRIDHILKEGFTAIVEGVKLRDQVKTLQWQRRRKSR
jgi:hypothetical protein